MHSRRLSVAVACAVFVPLAALLTPLAAVAAPAGPALTYSWVGSATDPQADNHSWTDRRNWSPTGVPGDGDAVNIVSPQSGPCDIHVDRVPTGLTLANFLLSTSITKGCQASVSGGSIAVAATFLWTGGTVDTPITIEDGAGALIGDEGAVVQERLKQPLTVLGGGLRLAQAHLSILDQGSLSLDPESDLTIGFANDIRGSTNGPDRARITSRGTITGSNGTLTLDQVTLDQRGEVDLDADSTIDLTRGSLLSHDGAEYVGPGRLTVANRSSAVLTRQQVLSDGFHLELGPRGRSDATLDGVATLTGDGSLDWTGGTIGAFLTLDAGVTMHAYGGRHARVGQRVLAGRDTRHHSPPHQIVSHGPVVCDDGAGFSMTDNAKLSISPDGSLSLAPGTRVRGLSSGEGDLIRVSNTTVLVPADQDHSGPVVLDNVGYVLEGGQTEVAPGSELKVTGHTRGNLAQTALTGGGTFSVAEPMDVVSVFTVGDDSQLKLLPGGSLDGSAIYTGEGTFSWLGGRLSGNDVGIQLNEMTVSGQATKSIDDDNGFTSFVEVLNPVTFTPGTKSRPNLLDMNDNSFQSFLACTVQRNVELQDGIFTASDLSAIVFDAGRDGTIVSDDDVQVFTSGPMTIASGTFVSNGAMVLNGGPVDIRAGATLRLPDPSHPLMLQQGTLSGVGTVDGDILNTGGVLDPLESGADRPLVVNGAYTQSAGGRLVLDISAASGPYDFGGAATIAGTVTLQQRRRVPAGLRRPAHAAHDRHHLGLVTRL